MSDPLCGPSNPLQQFKQQTQRDRTLQQDRLASRQSPSQGFRSANPNAGLLDPEFEAFQAGAPPSGLPHLQPFQQPPQQHGGPHQAPSWAAEFQQMHISSPPPFQQQRMSPSGPSPANWAQGFHEHVAQTQPRAQTSAALPQQFQQMARYGGMNGFQSSFAPMNMGPTMQSKGKEPAMEQFDEAAFERAFDQARDVMMGELQTGVVPAEAAQEEIGAGQQSFSDATVGDSAGNRTKEGYQEQLIRLEQENKRRLMEARQNDDFMHSEQTQRMETLQDPHQIREEALEEQAEAQERAKEDDDALAATARELLEKVQHNQSDKFRNSQFLDLMRKLRDREVKVEGDKMVETNNVATSSSVETQTLNSPSADAATTNAPRFDNSEQRPAPLPSVDTRPYEYGIPTEEQDHDAGRQGVYPQDGQEVVDILNQPGDVTDDIATSASDFESPGGPFYGDLRARNDSISEMLYGGGGMLSRSSPQVPPH